MALLQILEPGQTPDPVVEKKVAIGIDLGTTNSLIASVIDGNCYILEDEDGEALTPSIVYYGEQKSYGFKALEMAKSDPKNTIISVKRMIGRSLDDVQKRYLKLPYDLQKSENNLPLIKTQNGAKSAVEVSADLLTHLKEKAELTLSSQIEGAVITVPAYFDDSQRQATLDAAKFAGIKVLRLLNEPTAAALAYGLDSGNEGVIAVYDLGGGTFDISILRLSKGVFEVLATAGNTALGGDDFDEKLADIICVKTNSEASNSIENRELLTLAKEIKTRLTDTNVVNSVWKGVEFSVSIDEFNESIEKLVQSSIVALRRALKDANVTLDEVNEIVMVGGSTRVPLVRQKVANFFKKHPLTSIDPDKVVAIGAGIQADILIGNKTDNEMLLLDVVPLSLGIETMGGLVEKIIPRNTTIPIAKAQEFTTFKDGQTAMTIHVVQGEREMVNDCRSLGKFSLKGIPPMVAGAAHIQVTYQVDADGLLSVSAVEKSTGVKAAIEIKPSYGLTDNEISNMIANSFENAQIDMEKRRLAEANLEADRVIESVLSALNEDSHLLDETEINQITTAIETLIIAKQGSDSNEILNKMNQLDRATQNFATKRMDQSIAKALSGKNVNEIYD